MKRTIPRLVKSIHYTVWLGLLTLFVVTTVVPGKHVMLASERTTHPAGSLHLQPQSLLPITQGEQDFKVPLPVGEGFRVRAFPMGEGFRVRAFQGDIRPFPIAAVNQRPVEASDQLEQGRTLYVVGRFSEAVTLWKQAASRYETQGDRINQALSLSYLSLAYQDLGQWQDAQQAIIQSLDLITPNSDNPLIFAQALNTQASLQLAIGQPEAALETWKRAEDAYKAAGDDAGVMGSQINQAQALQTLGFFRRAQTLLEQVNQRLQAQPDSLLKATGLQSLGVALQVAGDLEQSHNALKQSLAITQQVDASADTSHILFSLGNTARALQQYEMALSYYHKVAEKATSGITKVEAQLNQLSLLIETQQWQAAQALFPQVQSQLSTLPPSRASVYAQVNLAESLMKMLKEKPQNKVALSQPSEIAQILTKSVQQARLLQDSRAESYSLGQMGELYAQMQQWSDAQKLTQEALGLAQAMNADSIAYRWQWQLGRILKQQGELGDAIAAYNEAVKTLQSLRSDLVAVNPDVQFSFRDSVEPVYREFVELLLQSEPNQNDLETARKVIESLQLAELDNFFREACLKAKPEQIDKIDPTAAVIYPIILSNRLAVILSLPGQPLRYYQTQLPETEIEGTLEQLLQSFNPAVSNKQRLRLSQKLYDWLLRPAETPLTESGIKTLVFVLDGSLRNLPMAALYDGQNYLIENYNIALSQGLQLLEPQSLTRNRLKALMGGLTEARQGFSPLPGVESELESISSEVRSEVLLNQQFTKATLKNQLQSVSFPVIHLATHGQFSSKAENTFLLTWDGRVNVKDLDQLLRIREREDTNPIELLVLSACQTAAGDKRATLGLAGFALRSGARSTLATLWSVRDDSTAELMSEFYQKLTQSATSKAEALRQAQLLLLKNPRYEHPFYWAPFVLVGNWL